MSARVPGWIRVSIPAHRVLPGIAVLVAALVAAGGTARAGEPAGAGTDPAPASSDFRIGVGDRLGIFVYGGEIFPEGREVCLVRSDGKISLPLVGELRAAGRTPSELAGVIAGKLEAYQENPEVTVSVEEIHSYRVFVLGEVANSMMIESVAPLTLLQALAMAGGLSDYASGNVIILRRGDDGKQERIRVDVEKILKGRAPADDVPLRAGDVVVALR